MAPGIMGIVCAVLSERLPAQVKKALDWYDEVVENQMLSYLDEATATVE